MTRRAETDASKTLVKWLKLNLPRHMFGALTGTDWRSLEAAAHILECYTYSGDPELLVAFRIVVERMQESTRQFAYHAPAHFGEWHHRQLVWTLAGLPRYERVWVLKGSPEGRRLEVAL